MSKTSNKDLSSETGEQEAIATITNSYAKKHSQQSELASFNMEVTHEEKKSLYEEGNRILDAIIESALVYNQSHFIQTLQIKNQKFYLNIGQQNTWC